MRPCSSGQTQAMGCLRSRFARNTIRFFPNCIGKTPWWIPSLLLRRIRMENRVWDGIRMEGPYCWRPPNVLVQRKIPRYLRLQRRAGRQRAHSHVGKPQEIHSRRTSSGPSTTPGSCTPEHGAEMPHSSNIQLALEQRYGPSTNVEDFVRKAQLAHYENTRAQFESFAASGWATHKMVGYWMLNSHWPSFYGNLIDYYLSPGGVYFGAKKGLRPLSVVFDYLCDRRQQPGQNHCFQSNSWRRAWPARSCARL